MEHVFVIHEDPLIKDKLCNRKNAFLFIHFASTNHIRWCCAYLKCFPYFLQPRPSSLAVEVSTVADLLLARQWGVCLCVSVLPSVRLGGVLHQKWETRKMFSRRSCAKTPAGPSVPAGGVRANWSGACSPLNRNPICEIKKREREEGTVERRTACASGSSGTYAWEFFTDVFSSQDRAHFTLI